MMFCGGGIHAGALEKSISPHYIVPRASWQPAGLECTCVTAQTPALARLSAGKWLERRANAGVFLF
jgi:hypothetical protein